MPLRLPLKRKASADAEVPFRRRTPPTPQATRLMRVSLGAGVLFVVVLGVVFVPIALRYGEVKPPVLVLGLVDQGPLVVEVVSASAPFALGTYRAWVNETNANGSRLNFNVDPLAANTTWYGAVTYTDTDGDGTVSAGDRFTIPPQPGSGWSYELSIFNSVRDRGAVPPCPCAVGQLRFP